MAKRYIILCNQTENEAAKEEVQDVLQALEELALNYDRKVQLAEEKTQELNQTAEELIEKNVSLDKAGLNYVNAK